MTFFAEKHGIRDVDAVSSVQASKNEARIQANYSGTYRRPVWSLT